MSKSAILRGMGRGARRIVEGEARERLKPVRDRLADSAERVQSSTGRKIDRLAGQIWKLGHRLDRPGEARLIARRLEETADYLRFRPAGHLVHDAASALRRRPLLPVAGALVAGLVAFSLLWNHRKNSHR